MSNETQIELFSEEYFQQSIQQFSELANQKFAEYQQVLGVVSLLQKQYQDKFGQKQEEVSEEE